MYILYLSLENYLPLDQNIIGLVQNIDYKRTGTSIFLNKVKSGKYGNCEIRKYLRIFTNTKYEDLIKIYPEVKKLNWPCEVGRYNIDDITFDVVFGSNISYDNNWDKKELNEYLNCEYGLWDNWVYGLKNSSLATITMELIKDIPLEKRVPWYITRYVTAMSDASNNENGILYGRWDGKYKDGEHPSTWKSVTEIMNKRLLTNKPVKYGQCWIFAEVLTAMFRFLGIPSRSIYAINSHIDCGMDKGIDMIDTITKGSTLYYCHTNISNLFKESLNNNLELDIEGDLSIQKGSLFGDDPLSNDQKIDIHEIVKNGDRAWNFHVWSEVYVCRYDLNNVCDWQVCDPCPVPDVKLLKNNDEFHDKHFFGPCPVSNIRDNICVNFDHPYLFSAVNSLWRYWSTYKKDEMIILYPYDINYKTMNPNITDYKRVLLYTRDPYLSNNLYVIKKDITQNYRYKDAKWALDSYHREYPFVVKTNQSQTDVEIEYHSYIKGKYLVQICYLKDNKLITCHRKIYTEIKNLYIPKRPENIDVMSILTVNIDTNEFYPQIL